MISDWFEQYGVDNFLPGKVCEHCGKSLAGMPYLSNRKYCSKSCGNKARYAAKHPVSRQKLKFDPALRARALELYWGGLGQTAIAEYLDVAQGTVCSWVHDFGGLQECRPKKEILRLRPPEERLKNAETAEEWQEALRDITPKKTRRGKTIRLVCSDIRGSSGINRLVTTILERLRLNPLSGETFAFRDTESKVISTICWDGEIFRIGKYPKTQGSFIWPQETFGTLVEIRENEFETMLSYHKKGGKKRRKSSQNRAFCGKIEA